jgi:serine/threonine-protein phosphatase CPPED1
MLIPIPIPIPTPMEKEGGQVKTRVVILFAILTVFILPGIGQEQPFYFIMLADPQFGMYTNNKGFIRETANYEFAVATVNRLKPSFVIVLGDLVNKEGNPEEIGEFLRITRKIDPSITVHLVAGNHDFGAEPTPQTLADYRKNIGRDYYSFRAGPVYGIVLNSPILIAPQKVDADYKAQDSWLKKELEAAKASGAQQIIVFQHHPYFSEKVDEPDGWGNVPLERRRPMLELLHRYGVRYVFAGHVHKNLNVKDGDLEMTTSGPVGMSFSEDESGIRMAVVTAEGVKHRYYNFGKLPDRLEIK